MNIEEIKNTINYLLDNNLKLVENGFDKITINIVGEAGIGKTSLVKQLAEERNAKYTRLNLSELEEIGDLCGIPVKYYTINKDGKELNVAEKVLDKYIAMGWTLCPDCDPKMSYAIPAWVPTDPEQEAILLLDDFNRANPLFMQAIMSLTQFGEYTSWKLPKKCHLILSSNPESGDYNISTSLDAAQKSRMINFDVVFDLNVYAKWMNKVGIRSELQNFALLTPEIFTRGKHINARSYTMFANAISGFKDLSSPESLSKINIISKGCFGDNYISGLFVQFINNKLDKLIDPVDILKGDWATVKDKLIENIYKGDNYMASIASVITIRFINFIDNYFNSSLDKNKSEKLIDRLIDICSYKDKILFSEDLLYKMIKSLNMKYPTRCAKLLKYPNIRTKLF